MNWATHELLKMNEDIRGLTETVGRMNLDTHRLETELDFADFGPEMAARAQMPASANGDRHGDRRAA